MSDSYGYDEFGQDLYVNQRIMQPFGFTGYQRDNTAGTYFAQTREYRSVLGRLVSEDTKSGFLKAPMTMNRYTYCFNSPITLVDLNGMWPQFIEDFGKNVSNAWNGFCEDASYVWNNYIYGTDIYIIQKIWGMGKLEK